MAQCPPESSSLNPNSGSSFGQMPPNAQNNAAVESDDNSAHNVTQFVAQVDFQAPYTDSQASSTNSQAPSTGTFVDDRQLSAYDYDLPESLIAQNPASPRDSSKLLVLTGPDSHYHAIFRDVVDWLLPGDLLVLNNTRVIPARLFGRKQNSVSSGNFPLDNQASSDERPKGAAAEVLLIEPLSRSRWLALVKPGKRLQPGATIVFDNAVGIPVMTAVIEARDEPTKGRIVQLMSLCDSSIDELIHELGQVPLPPYIKHSESLPEQYQTVFAQHKGAIAAPTAGLHFTQELLHQLAAKGIETAEVTLHVGIGTFRPVEVTDIETHQMHQERIEVPLETVEKIRRTKAQGGRVIAVGTTSTRALEGAAAIAGGELQPYKGKTEIFIYPGYQWQVIDGLITNFHLPGSSLLMMVSALMGRQRLMAIYQDAIAQNYRFYSFGDAMLILPEATI